MTKKQQYQYDPKHLENSSPNFFKQDNLKSEEMILNIGPQHPSTHGVLRLELVTDGEVVKEVMPHIGYLHRCFEKHAESLPLNQTIPFVDRLDYLAAMNSEHIFAVGIEKMLGIEEKIPKRVKYIRVLVAELNRLASHFLGVGAYAIDMGAVTPFLWLLRDREHILRLLEWISGARMLYNYIWIGGLYYDLPVGFEEQCLSFIKYLKPKIKEFEDMLIDNKIFIHRTANIGILPLDTAINFGCSGPVLRGSGLKFDLRKVEPYSVYSELDFDIPVGKGLVGTLGDNWDRTYVRVKECYESVRIIEQCIEKLTKEHKRTREFDPREAVPKKIFGKEQEFYFRGESSKGELGFYYRMPAKKEVPLRVKARSCAFSNLSVISEISRGAMIADIISILGSLDFVLGEVDR